MSDNVQQSSILLSNYISIIAVYTLFNDFQAEKIITWNELAY
jgi:hypothetical protein